MASSKAWPEFDWLSTRQLRQIVGDNAAGRTVRALAIHYGVPERTIRHVLQNAPTAVLRK